ncbi:rCG45064, isoform CRA_b [Rattus norvegicus]|uniref:RCG45064, isoform CRA_b n=1 Tax=Rattus norvegicus TaxID=10116 RepID=A6KQX2_RAT|nr:rCG45064, isoform CRA_b [Rattus norvegicus]
MNTYGGEVLSGALQDLGMGMWQQAGVAWLGKAALHTVNIPRAILCLVVDWKVVAWPARTRVAEFPTPTLTPTSPAATEPCSGPNSAAASRQKLQPQPPPTCGTASSHGFCQPLM